MMKFTTRIALFAAAAMLAVSAKAQDTSSTTDTTDGITQLTASGWYQIKVKAGTYKMTKTVNNGMDSATVDSLCKKGRNYIQMMDDPATAKNTKYPVIFDSLSTATPAATFFYIHKGDQDSHTKIMAADGLWMDGKAQANESEKNFTVQYSTTTFSGWQFSNGSQYWVPWKFTGSTYNGIGDTQYGSNMRYTITQVDTSAYKIYSVQIDGLESGGRAVNKSAIIVKDKDNKGTQKVYNGGKVFYTSTVQLSADSITLTPRTDYKASVTVDESNKIIKAGYTLDLQTQIDKLKKLIAQADTLKDKSGLGWPAADSIRTNLSKVVTDGNTVLKDSTTLTEDNLNKFKAAIDSLENRISQFNNAAVTMPEDGKAYRVYFLLYDANGNPTQKIYLHCQDNQTGKCSTTDDGELFVMQLKNDSTYRLASTTGKGTITKTTYSYTRTSFFIQSATASGYPGYFVLYAPNPSDKSKSRYVAGKASANLDHFNKISGYESSTPNWSAIVAIEEAEYTGFNVTFGHDNGDDKNYATVNLPFAVTLPEGVTAYSGTQQGDVVNITAVKNAGEVLPAETPVLLTATDAKQYTFPATKYDSTQVETNFKGTLAAATVTTTDGTPYILAKKGDYMKFYVLNTATKVNGNRAYYVSTGTSSAQALSFRFADTVTAIEAAKTESLNAAPIYDLSGRRVQNATKGGIYIRGGKKFIVK